MQNLRPPLSVVFNFLSPPQGDSQALWKGRGAGRRQRLELGKGGGGIEVPPGPRSTLPQLQPPRLRLSPMSPCHF